jgi:cellular nucleic acid-binding protein
MSGFLFQLRKKIRYLFQKSTIYVLECEHGKFYVGSTLNRRQRIDQHFESSRGGSVWTKQHRPIRVIEFYRRVPYRYRLGLESQITAKYMWERGVNNVRGSQFSQPRTFTSAPADLEGLVGFLGHYNDLSFQEVRQRLHAELPSSIPNFTGRKRNRNRRRFYDGSEWDEDELDFEEDEFDDEYDEDDSKFSFYGEQVDDINYSSTSSPSWISTARCYNCQEIGHLAKDCPKSKYATDKQCYLCGEYNHLAADCPNSGTDPRCFKCGELGHFARDCRATESRCFVCGRPGHKAKDCPDS